MKYSIALSFIVLLFGFTKAGTGSIASASLREGRPFVLSGDEKNVQLNHFLSWSGIEYIPAAPDSENNEAYTYVENMPQFPDGPDAMDSFIAENIKYPEIARRAGVEGSVMVEFIVDKFGHIRKPEIIRGIGAGCDEEAIRVVKLMPDWIPGNQNGLTVPVKITVKISFSLM